MATKKAGSAKKSTRAKSQTAKSNVTTVKAVEAAKSRGSLFSGRQTVLVAALIGEFVGTFLLTCAFLVTKGEPLYMGFVFVALVLMVGTLSGAYLNPVLTVGAWVTRKLGHMRTLGYLLAQVLGAGAAFMLLSAFIQANAPDTTANTFQQAPQVFELAPLNEKTQWFVFGAELLGAAIFAFAWAGAWRVRTDRVARAIGAGFGLFVAALVAGVCASYVMANVALNPAIAMAAGAVDWSNINWFAVAVYMVAPLIGGIVGFALRDVVETEK